MAAAAWPAVVAADDQAAEYRRLVLGRFIDVVSRRNLRNRGLVRFVGRRLRPGGRYGSARGTTMVKHLLDSATFADLPDALQVVVTATDLSAGRAFRMSQSFMGSWDHGYAEGPALGLATALAASTAVPLIFPPVHLRAEGLGLNIHRELSLVDGGVYDNLGLEWFQGWSAGRPPSARECDFLIAVDCTGTLDRRPHRFGWARSISRSQMVQYATNRSTRVRWFVDSLLAGDLNGIYVPTDRDPLAFRAPVGGGGITVEEASDGALPVGFAKLLSGVRTDLDRFSVDELQLLTYHGYWSTHVRLAVLHPELAVKRPAWRTFADLDECEVSRLSETLSRGARFRISR
jgi:predicted acylesterase/phospholipase RssA